MKFFFCHYFNKNFIDRRRRNKGAYYSQNHAVSNIKPRAFSGDFVYNELAFENHNTVNFNKLSIVNEDVLSKLQLLFYQNYKQ